MARLPRVKLMFYTKIHLFRVFIFSPTSSENFLIFEIFRGIFPNTLGFQLLMYSRRVHRYSVLQDIRKITLKKITARIGAIHDVCKYRKFFKFGPVQDSLVLPALFHFPKSAKRVWIDVGSDWTTFTSRSLEVWPGLKWSYGRSSAREFIESRDLYAIAIDANKLYFRELSRFRRVLPIFGAVTEADGEILFNHYVAPGASSVLYPGASALGSPGIPDSCTQILYSETVPSYRLDTILRKIPKNLVIEFLKVDTQGNDLKVVQSAGVELQRVMRVMLEVQDTRDGNPDFYKDQDTYTDAVDFMASEGFWLNHALSWMENNAANEWNLVFDKRLDT